MILGTDGCIHSSKDRWNGTCITSLTRRSQIRRVEVRMGMSRVRGGLSEGREKNGEIKPETLETCGRIARICSGCWSPPRFAGTYAVVFPSMKRHSPWHGILVMRSPDAALARRHESPQPFVSTMVPISHATTITGRPTVDRSNARDAMRIVA
jgi:hypothetical protein